MLWDVPHIIAELSTFYELKPGVLIFCGTPAGVGPVKPGDQLEGGIEGLEVLRITIASAQRAGWRGLFRSHHHRLSNHDHLGSSGPPRRPPFAFPKTWTR